MMEAKIKVRLDTAQARAQLRQLTTEAGKVGGAFGGGGGGGGGIGMRGALSALGIGGLVGAGLARLRQPTESGLGAMFGTLFDVAGDSLSKKLLGGMGPEALGAQRARDEVAASYGQIAGHLGRIPTGARAEFEHLRRFYTERAKGERDIRIALGSEATSATAAKGLAHGINATQRALSAIERGVEAFIEWAAQNRLRNTGGQNR